MSPAVTNGQATVSRVEPLARAQLGLLTRAQCLGLGMTPGALKWMVYSGRWQRVYLGVYARFGWADVDARPCEVAQGVAVLLQSRGWRGSLKRCGAHCQVSVQTS